MSSVQVRAGVVFVEESAQSLPSADVEMGDRSDGRRRSHGPGSTATVVPLVAEVHPDLPDAGYTADGGLLPGPHAKPAGPAFQEWLDTSP